MQHSFRKLLRKNLLYMALPVVLILSGFLLLLVQVSRLEMFRTHTMEDPSLIREYYSSGQMNVSVTMEGLKSTGISVKEGDKETAEYFYLIMDKKVQLVLLTEKTAKSVRADGKAPLSLHANIVKDEVTAGYMEREYAASLGIETDEMTGLCSVYVFDETAYPRIRIQLLRYSSIGIAVLLGLIMLYVILATAVPALNHEARVLRRFGRVGRYIRKLDREMEKKLRFHQDNVTVTENYLIVSYITHIDVVRIDDIKYLSKHIEKRKRGFGRPIHVYRLTASNADDLYFEADFFEEEIINDVIYFMRGEPLLEYEEHVLKEKEEEENEMAQRQQESDLLAEEEGREAEQEIDNLFDDDELT